MPCQLKPVFPAIRRKSNKKKVRSVLFDDRGFTDPQCEFEDIPTPNRPSVLRKRLHPALPLTEIDPKFNTQIPCPLILASMSIT